MKIEQITLYHIRPKLVSPFATSFGLNLERPCILVAIQSEGVIGWGECVAFDDPGYCYETIQTAWHISTDFLIPKLLGINIEEPEELQKIFFYVRGHPLAKAAFDQALWDLTAQRDNVSVAQKLANTFHIPPKERVEVGVSVGIQTSIEKTIEVIADYLAQGYKRIKLKIKPSFDVKLAHAVRQAYPDIKLMLDANSAYTLADVGTLQALDDLNLLMLEQPLAYDDIYEHSMFKQQIASPLCLDESIASLANAYTALGLHACDVINIKPGRVGGWTVARAIHNIAVDAGISLWVGGMLESGVGRAGQLALAALPGFNLPSDISASDRYYQPDIAAPFTLNREDSTITVPNGIGLGVEIDYKQLAKVTIHQETFRP